LYWGYITIYCIIKKKDESEKNMQSKYKILFDDTIEYNAHILYRIEALKDFSNVKKGDLGGYIESYANLDQEGNCWVYDNSFVLGDAQLTENSVLKENVVVSGKSSISGDSEIIGNVIIDNSIITGKNVILNRGFLSDISILKTAISNNVTIILNGCDTKFFISLSTLRNGVNIISNESITIQTVTLDGNIHIRERAYISSEKDIYFIQMNGKNKHITFFKDYFKQVSVFIGGVGLFDLCDIEKTYENIVTYSNDPMNSDFRTIDTFLDIVCRHMSIELYEGKDDNNLTFRKIREYVVA
jgi:hypothetical protein